MPLTPSSNPGDILSIRYASEKDHYNLIESFALDQCQDFSLVILLGERLSCCPEAIIARAQIDTAEGVREIMVGFCTMAPEGEQRDLKPTVVGCAVDPRLRHMGIGQELLQRGIVRLRQMLVERDQERAEHEAKFGVDVANDLFPQLLTTNILVQAVTRGGARLSRKTLQQLKADGSGEWEMRPEYADVKYEDHSRAF